ncbi:MAG TPA: hypothetical protein VMZ53_15200 [Kofleriaceae bacterium]|nr:hypothetical protein [Kofleriaceae bacterium]
MTRIAVTVLVLVAAARTAHAGWDCPEKHSDAIKNIETYAKNPKAFEPPSDTSFGPDFLCADGVAKEFPDRVAAACKTILDRKGDKHIDDCIDLAAFAGLTQVGDHDIFALIAARKENPLSYPGGFWWPRLNFLGAMRDARGLPIIIDEWTDASAIAPKKKGWGAVKSWALWRRTACNMLASFGGADEVAFLEREVAATRGKDARSVKNACNAAITAIKKRLGTP